MHGSCKTVVTDYRPVPLHWAFCRNVDGKAKLGPLLDDAGVLLNSELTESATDSTDDDDIEFAIRRTRGRSGLQLSGLPFPCDDGFSSSIMLIPLSSGPSLEYSTAFVPPGLHSTVLAV